MHQRQKYIEATPLPQRLLDSSKRRRSKNFVKKESHDNEKFENFFDYEEELASLKPSNELYNSTETDFKAKNDELNIEKNANSDDIVKGYSDGIIMKKKKPNVSQVDEKPKYMQVEGFDFKQCSYIKENGERCKRQAPKTSDRCSKHR